MYDFLHWWNLNFLQYEWRWLNAVWLNDPDNNKKKPNISLLELLQTISQPGWSGCSKRLREPLPQEPWDALQSGNKLPVLISQDTKCKWKKKKASRNITTRYKYVYVWRSSAYPKSADSHKDWGTFVHHFVKSHFVRKWVQKATTTRGFLST